MRLGARSLPVAALILASSLAAQSELVGSVWEVRGDEKHPLEGAFVQARVVGGRGVFAQARSGPDGAYRLSLPGQRYAVSVIARSYYVAVARGREVSSITVECPTTGRCGSIDFELKRGEILEGHVVDDYDLPLPLARVGLYEARDSERPVKSASSDDRGYFRMWGVKPGEYWVRSVMTRDRSIESEPFELELEAGRREPPLQVVFRSIGPRYSVSGVVQGFPLGEDEHATVQLAPVDGRLIGRNGRMDAESSGFRVDSVPAGEYIVVVSRRRRHGGRIHRAEQRLLGKITVDRDIEGLELAAMPPTGISARVWLDDLLPSRMAFVSLISKSNPGRVIREQIRAPEYRLEREDLLPGKYQLRSRSYEYFLLSPREITVTAGRVENLSIRLSTAFAALEGQVRPAPGTYLVGLSGDGRKRVVETDQNGGFAFTRLVPGRYQIAAWADLGVDVESDETWRRAGQAAREFELGEGDGVELSLTAILLEEAR